MYFTRLYSAGKKTPFFGRCLSEIAEIEAGEVLKTKEFTGVIDCFWHKPNEDIGVFWRTLYNSMLILIEVVQRKFFFQS